MSRLLITDDDLTMMQMISRVLEDEGYAVDLATDSREVMQEISMKRYDLYVLGISLVDGSQAGLTLCQNLRRIASTSQKPIIFLAENHEREEAVKSLEIGGDDYLYKPFAIRELSARIRAHLRRASLSEDALSEARLYINPASYQVFVDGEEVFLTRIEFSLLHYMVRSDKQWYSPRDLLAGVWQYPKGTGDTALVRNHIRNLRRKLEIRPHHTNIIDTRHGRGYTVRARVEVEQGV